MCNIANYLKLYKKLNEKAQPWQRRKEGSKKQPVTICNGFVSLYGGYGRLPLKRSLRMMVGRPRTFAVVVTRRVTRTVSEMPRSRGPFGNTATITRQSHTDMRTIIQTISPCLCLVSCLKRIASWRLRELSDYGATACVLAAPGVARAGRPLLVVD